MADDIDRANEHAERLREEALARRERATLEPGQPGECEWCGEFSQRLVGGVCAPCRELKGEG